MKLLLMRSFLALGLAMSSAMAQDGALPDHNLSEWTLGEHLFGDEVEMKNLEGRVVVLEVWGVN